MNGSWHMPGRVDEGTVVWSVHNDPHSWQADGWAVEARDGRFEVCYRTHERMRIGADGSLGIGRPQGYWFNTREWAELCKRRMESLDRAFGRRGSFLAPAGSLGIGLGTPSPLQPLMFQIKANASHVLLEINANGQVTKFDVPVFLAAWWRGTRAHRVWQQLMWGERGRG